MSYRSYYILWIFISIISFLSAVYVPVSEKVHNILALPGIISLFAASIQGVVQTTIKFWQDYLAFKRQLEIQRRDQDFTIGIASKMAEDTFQKHVEFCEQYLKRAHEILQEIYAKGAHAELYESAKSLVRIREQYAAWLTEEIEISLIPFEQNVREIGGDRLILDSTAPGSLDRRTFTERISTAMIELMDRKGENQGQGNIIKIIGVLREVLGTNQLTELRRFSLNDAISRIEKRR